MSTTWKHSAVRESDLGRLAERLALILRPGDVVALKGDLGAGKTTFARALLRVLLCDAAIEVPSPTFSLVQTYAAQRFEVAHIDLYRVGSAAEIAELGLEDILARGVALIEWPERAAGLLPADLIEIEMREAPGAPEEERDIIVRAHGGAAPRLSRLMAIAGFIDATEWRASHLHYIQGDASTRRYVRLACDGSSAVLMDAPRQPDGPPVRGGLPYSRIAHLAEDVRPYIAVARALRRAGLSAPAILREQADDGLLLLEDLGDNLFGRALAAGADQETLWGAAVDVLLHLGEAKLPPSAALAHGSTYSLPAYDRAALTIELELLLDWYWPAVHGVAAPATDRAEFLALWDEVLDRLLAMPTGWVLRDFHSPNLLWLPDRAGVRRIGVLDFQDAVLGHPAYDVVSLLQDARLDVPASLEQRLLARYLSGAAGREGFDGEAFALAYAALGAQRCTKILGIFTRLSHRDGKHGYLHHIPRLWRYLERDLEHVTLRPLERWYDRCFPRSQRAAPSTP